MLVVGLTGGIGSGKSTACRFFAEQGTPVIDADVIAHQLVKSGSNSLAQISAEFGPEILTESGELDRMRLRQLIFSDPDKRLQLESILHPKIGAEIQKQIAGLNAPYCILAIPLLIEKNWNTMVDRILIIDSPLELQHRRALTRDNSSEQEIDAIIATQSSRETRLSFADDVIINDSDMETLKKQVKVLHREYLKCGLE